MANFQSNFVFGLQGNHYEEFVDIVVKPIIEKIIGTNDYKIISFDKHLSDMDFDNKKRRESIFPEFYLNFLEDIDKADNGVSFKKKICITLDERLCNAICPSTGRKITSIKIAGVELAYFIYFDVKEFFDFVYSQKNNNLYQQLEKNSPLYERLGYKTKDEFNSDLRSSKKLVALLERLGIDVPKKQGKIDLIPAVSKNDKEFLELLNHENQDIKDIVQAKLDMKHNSYNEYIDNNAPIIERIGYIANINTERKLSFVHDSDSGNSGFPIMYGDFPDVVNYPIGTIIKAYGYFNSDGNRFFVDSYEVGEPEDLPFELLHLEGTLKCHDTKNYAIIKTNVGGVIVNSDLLLGYSKNKIYNVRCVAIPSYDKKRKTMGRKAIYVENLDDN